MIEIVREIIGKGEPVFGKIPYLKGENMCLYDTNKAHKIRGWTPNHSLQSGLNTLSHGIEIMKDEPSLVS